MHPLDSWEMLYWHHIPLDQAGLFALARRHAPLSDCDGFPCSFVLILCAKTLPEAETALGTILKNYRFVHPWTKKDMPEIL